MSENFFRTFHFIKWFSQKQRINHNLKFISQAQCNLLEYAVQNLKTISFNYKNFHLCRQRETWAELLLMFFSCGHTSWPKICRLFLSPCCWHYISRTAHANWNCGQKRHISAHEKNIGRKVFLPTIIITLAKIDFLATFVSWTEIVSTNENIFVSKKRISFHDKFVGRSVYMHVSEDNICFLFAHAQNVARAF